MFGEELLLEAFVGMVLEKLTDAAMLALARHERMSSHFDKLQKLFILIKAVLEDAEDKQLASEPVKAWLEELRDLTYDLDDLLSEITYRALYRNYHKIQNLNTSRVSWIHVARSKMIHSCGKFMPGGLVFNCRLLSKIRQITKRLDHIAEQKTALNLRENGEWSSNRARVIWSGSSPVVNEYEVYGRDDDKKAIKKMLLTVESSGQNFSVVPIVGMGGVGKSTLAQLLYNDSDVKENFGVRVWVHVSQEFDALKITKNIYKSMTKMSGTGEMDLAMLQEELQEMLMKIKFLIVLDDVWNEDYAEWHNLFRPLMFGLPGSKVLVTTRNHVVASVVGCAQYAYHMQLLADEDCQCILSQHAQTCFVENSNLQEVVQGLAKKCKGLPLAAKVLGGILRSKTSESEWKDVLNSKLWGLPQDNNILPVLRLSYLHLPSHLRNPFAYCSVFPKDYEFDPNELVLLWMGEGFLDVQNERRRKEDLGHEYFNELLSRSFFQRKSGRDSAFVMHDLIRELADFVSGGVCCHLEKKSDTAQQYQLPKKTRHASFLCHEYEVFHDFESFGQVKGLRTFLPMPGLNPSPPFHLSNKILVELLPRLRSLRTLSLSGYSITELPSSICSLILLRHLNLSETLILTLPSSISGLLCLEILCLSKCRFILDLPSTLGDLSNLRHLDISDTDQLKEMPVEIGELIHLHTSSKIVLSRADKLGLKELRFLKQLRGTLAIFDLQNIANLDDAREANLWCKRELEDLQLSWGNGTVNSQGISHEDVIDRLQPHHNLRKLKIESYKGVNFPGWIGDPLYQKLSSLCLTNCIECTSLPPLGLPPGLEHLHIGGMPKIKCTGMEFYGSGPEVPFQRLETLRFDDMQGWEEWSACTRTDGSPFPLLRKLTMSKCDKLDGVALLRLPSLQELDIEECHIVLLKSFCDLENVKNLKVKSVTALSHLPMELMQPTLEVLECRSCNEMLFVWPSKMCLTRLPKLRHMVIAECDQLVSLGEGEQHLPCRLEVLELLHCGNMTSLSNDLSNLELLRELVIKDCVKFVDFPKDGIPPNVKILEILGCHALKSLPANISELEILEIKDCSSLKTWKMANFPPTVKKLMLANCDSLEPVTKSMFPKDRVVSLEDVNLSYWLNYKHFLRLSLNFSNVFELYLSSCDGLEHFPEQGLPPRLRLLSIKDCKQLKSIPTKIRGMRSMVSLEMWGCPELDNFPNCDFPPNLSSLSISESMNFKPLNEWGLKKLDLLEEFSICGGFENLELLGDCDMFPPSLMRLSIARFTVLNSISNVLENLSLLRELSIMNCPKLRRLPGKQLLEKLGRLEICECPLLKKKCLKNSRSKIAGIPYVKMD